MKVRILLVAMITGASAQLGWDALRIRELRAIIAAAPKPPAPPAPLVTSAKPVIPPPAPKNKSSDVIDMGDGTALRKGVWFGKPVQSQWADVRAAVGWFPPGGDCVVFIDKAGVQVEVDLEACRRLGLVKSLSAPIR